MTRKRGGLFDSAFRFLDKLEDVVLGGLEAKEEVERTIARLAPASARIELSPELLGRLGRLAELASARVGRRVGIVGIIELLVLTAERAVAAAPAARKRAAQGTRRPSSV